MRAAAKLEIRADDVRETIDRRFAEFRKLTAPMIELLPSRRAAS